MKKFGKFLLKAFVAIIAIIAVVIVGIIGLRAYKGSKYTIMQAAAAASDDSQYETGDDIVRIREGAVIGYRFTPKERTHPGTVVVYGGSEGSPNYQQAKTIYEQGYEVLALYFWGQEGQQPTLANVPLDQFAEVEQYIRSNVEQPTPITVIGTSKGAEFSAELAAHGYGVDNLVNFTPADHTYNGLDSDYQNAHSSFTNKGEALPFAAFANGDPSTSFGLMWSTLVNEPPAYRAIYESVAANSGEETRIDLSSFRGNALFFAGDKDAMWQGDVAAQNLAAQSESFEAHVFADAGHVFSDRLDRFGTGWEIMFGGTAEGGKKAYEESNAILFERLAAWHGQM